jgi:serine/threonine protein kinase
MAEVFKAKSFGVEGFEKIIAIKRILPSMAEDGDFIEMFIDEAKIAGQLSHANICQIFELGKIGDSHFIAMEWIWGKDLLQISNRFRKLKQTMPIPLACYVAAKVCEGLDYAHRKRDAQGRPLQIIHRDVSPQNVLVSYEGEVKLIDFGIAKAAVRSSRTQHGILKGKFGYMSPEQVRGLPLDRRSDLFAIGTLLWECLAGERLFAGDSDFATLEKVRAGQAIPPSRKNPNVPPELDRIVLKALATEVADRYQWANAIQDDLQQVLVRFEPVFTAKQLSAWIKDAFAADLERERRELEAQKRLRPPEDDDAARRPVENDQTLVNPPGFGAGPAAAGFGEEGPTEIFGEISSSDVSLDVSSAPAASMDSSISDLHALPSDPGHTPEPAPLVMPLAPPPQPPAAPPTTSAPPPQRPPAPMAVLPLASQPMQPLPLRAPAPDPPLRVTPAPPRGSAFTEPLPRAAPARPRRSPVAFLTAAIVAVVVIGGGYLVGTRVLARRPAEPPPAAPTTTLVVATSDAIEGEVWVDGVRRGRVAGEPLTLEGLAVGEHDVVCKRQGASDAAQRVALDARGAKVVTCRFQTTQTGTLLLTVLTDGATVLVDKQEISAEAAKEPLILEAGPPHEIVVQKDGYHPRTFALTLHPGEVIGEKVELQAMPVPRPQATARRHERGDPEPAREREPAGPGTPSPAPSLPSPGDEHGFLVVTSTPWARVWVDGRDTGKMTPITERAKIPVAAGKHTVTFFLGDQKFSYTVMVEPGQDYVLSKQLPVGN